MGSRGSGSKVEPLRESWGHTGVHWTDSDGLRQGEVLLLLCLSFPAWN